MKYYILLKVEVEAAPVDFGGAAKKGFDAIAKAFNSGEPIKVGIVPIDGGPEAIMAQKVLGSCMNASTTPKF